MSCSRLSRFHAPVPGKQRHREVPALASLRPVPAGALQEYQWQQGLENAGLIIQNGEIFRLKQFKTSKTGISPMNWCARMYTVSDWPIKESKRQNRDLHGHTLVPIIFKPFIEQIKRNIWGFRPNCGCHV